MASLFISHSSADRSAALRVRDRLQAEGFASIFLDFDPQQGIPAGRNWERELYAQLRKTDAVVFLSSRSSVGSKWCHAELALARSIGRPVFPMLISGDSKHPLLQDVQWIDLVGEGDGGFARLWNGLRAVGLTPHDSFAWDSARSPYPGLESFAEQDAAVFFGREVETERLLKLLTPTLERGASRFLAVIGPSGSGKSSLVRAGLLPRIQRLTDHWIVVPGFTPGERPIRNLARSLVQVFGAWERELTTGEVQARLTAGGTALAELADDLRDAARIPSASVLLFIDQAEQLFARTEPAERREFLGLVQDTLQRDRSLWILATLRSEFLSSAPEHAGIAAIIDDPLLLEPLDRSRLAEVIERPAARAGLDFQAGLVSRMVEETTGGDALPLLAFTLRQLWQRAGPDGSIDAATYDAVGGVIAALERQAEQLTEELGRRGSGELIIPTLMKFVSVDAQGTPTARRIRRAELSTQEDGIIEAFVAARLLKTHATGEASVEVVHEALLRQWPPLRRAIEARSSDLQLRTELERLAQDWQRAEHHSSYLLRGERLQEARSWAEANPDLSTEAPLIGQFLADSAAQDQAALQLAANALANRILESFDDEPELRLLLALAAVDEYMLTRRAIFALAAALAAPYVCLVLSSSTMISTVEWSQDGTRIVTTSQYSAQVWDAITGADLLTIPTYTEMVTAAHWSADGAHILTAPDSSPGWGDPSGDPTIFDATTGARIRDFRGHSPAWSPDGTRIVSATSGKDSQVWDAATGAKLLTLPGHQPAWSPDGTRIATVREDLHVWDAATGARLLTLHGHHPAWSPDGTRIAAISREGAIHIWDAAASPPRKRLLKRSNSSPMRQLPGNIYSRMAWAPDGSRLAVSEPGGTARVWDVNTGDEEIALPGSSNTVADLAWSPDGTRLAIASSDNQARIWQVDGPQTHTLRCGGQVWSLAYSSDGTRLLTIGTPDSSGVAHVWNATTGARLWTLPPHGGRFFGAAWSPDGFRIVVVSDNGSAKIWDASTGQELLTLQGYVREPMSPSPGAAWSPDGIRIITRTADHTARVWDTTTGTELLTLSHEGQDQVTKASWSPDGTRIVTDAKITCLWDASTGEELLTFRSAVKGDAPWSPDGTRILLVSTDHGVEVSDAATGAELITLRGHERSVSHASWSPDGTRVLTGSDDKTARVWDAATGAELVTLRGHEAEIRHAAWSPNGTHVLTGSEDKTARVWDAATGAELIPLVGHRSAITVAAWSPDGTQIGTSSYDATARIWALYDVEQLRAMAKRHRVRSLSQDERRRFGLPER
jgi:WD40 repeat protein